MPCCCKLISVLIKDFDIENQHFSSKLTLCVWCFLWLAQMPHYKMVSTWVTPEAMAAFHAEGLRRAKDGWLQDRNRVHPEGTLDDVMKVHMQPARDRAGAPCACTLVAAVAAATPAAMRTSVRPSRKSRPHPCLQC